MSVKDHYQDVIREIMRAHNISPIMYRPRHEVEPETSFEEVVQHTDFYVGKGNDEQEGSEPHYRYRRYREAIEYVETLEHLEMVEERKAHVDIGCGAGLFSWVFLDWAIEKGTSWDNLGLYGFDHSPEMINLARNVRNRLKKEMPSYPTLHYNHAVTTLLRELEETHRDGTDYIVTLGHVLAQTANISEATSNFASIIARIYDLMANLSDCALVAVDAKYWSEDFRAGWDSLLNSLQSLGIRCETQRVVGTVLNDYRCARIAVPHKA